MFYSGLPSSDLLQRPINLDGQQGIKLPELIMNQIVTMIRIETIRERKYSAYRAKYLVTTWYLLGLLPVYQSWKMYNTNK